jgi:hypothetical protein
LNIAAGKHEDFHTEFLRHLKTVGAEVVSEKVHTATGQFQHTINTLSIDMAFPNPMQDGSCLLVIDSLQLFAQKS